MVPERYTRFTDNKQRLFVVLAVWHDTTQIHGRMHFLPTTVELLDVAREEARRIPWLDFEEYVGQGMLRQLPSVRQVVA